MKKSFLSIVAVVAMAFAVVSCGNGKVVDAQVKKINEFTAKIDSVQTLEELNALSVEFATTGDEFAKSLGETKLSAEETAKITDATTALMTKFAEVTQKLQEQLAADTTTAPVAEEAPAEVATKETK